jgi:prevent-host-death family protein
MRTVGLFEAKTRFSAICQDVDTTHEPVLVTRHGKPLVRILPVDSSEKEPASAVWQVRESRDNQYGSIKDDFTPPVRALDEERYGNILEI